MTEPDKYLPRFAKERLSRRQWIWSIAVMAVSALACLGLIVVNVVTVPYVSFSAGSVYSTTEIIEVESDQLTTYQPDNDVGFITVGVSQRLTLWRYFFDLLDDRIEIVEQERITGGRTDDQVRNDNIQLMSRSQSTSASLALEFLGMTQLTLYPAPATEECFAESVPGFGDGSDAGSDSDSDERETDETDETLNMPAELAPYLVFLREDVVQGVNGVEVDKAGEMLAVLAELPPDEPVIVEGVGSGGSVFRQNPMLEVLGSLSGGAFHFKVSFPDAPVTNADADADASTPAPCLLEQYWFAYDSADPDLVEAITLDAGEITGPSAGLAFTLSIIDLLSPGNLTGDLRVATTGTITHAVPVSGFGISPLRQFETGERYDICGRNFAAVCHIGGAAQKAVAVDQRDYDLLLVPAVGNHLTDASRTASDDLRIIPVSTLHEAVTVLNCLGGEPVEAASNYADLSTANLPDCDSIPPLP